MTTIEANLQIVRARILDACQQAGRRPEEVRLLAVSKTVAPELIALAHRAGQQAFAENYIQEGVEKISALSALGLEWHCIGPVQSNKSRLVAEHFDWVQTVDRFKIAQRLEQQRPTHLPPLQVCLQVNVDGGPNKSGVRPEQLPELAAQVSQLKHLRLRGLMCIPEPAPDFEAARSVFAKARDLFDQLNAGGLQLDTLSMGMTADLEAAIHAGSTMVRVGTAIFGARA